MVARVSLASVGGAACQRGVTGKDGVRIGGTEYWLCNGQVLVVRETRAATLVVDQHFASTVLGAAENTHVTYYGRDDIVRQDWLSLSHLEREYQPLALAIRDAIEQAVVERLSTRQ